jgi:putative mRNA 3-end processing factor
MVRWLCQNGLDAKAFDTEYGDDEEVALAPATPDPADAAQPEATRQEGGDA